MNNEQNNVLENTEMERHRIASIHRRTRFAYILFTQHLADTFKLNSRFLGRFNVDSNDLISKSRNIHECKYSCRFWLSFAFFRFGLYSFLNSFSRDFNSLIRFVYLFSIANNSHSTVFYSVVFARF